MKIGVRLFYDQEGDILFRYEEMEGSSVLPRKELMEIHHIDLDYGEVDFKTHRITGIDINTNQPILEELPINESEEKRRIRELEDELLLQADQELGGIL